MLNEETDATRRDPNVKDTPSLIASDRVEGTRVYGADGKHIGSIERLIIGKQDGRVAYAVLSFGGFLGIGHDHYPLPWEKLTYNTEIGGYVTDIDRDVLEGAPSYTDQATATWDDETWARGVYTYYGVHPFWDFVP